MPTLTEPRRVDTASTIREVRTTALATSDFVVRKDGDGAKRFAGHAAVFDARTAIGNPLGWGWYEEVATSAFDRTLDQGDARFLVDHDTSLLVARVSAGDLSLATDGIGLAVDAELDQELSYVRDLTRNLERRRLTGMSFGFYVVKDEWSTIAVETKDGDTIDAELRRLIEVRLLEVSAVTFPAYDQTDAGLKRAVEEIRAARLPDLPPATGEEPDPADATRDNAADPADATRRATVALLARYYDLAATRRPNR